MPKVIVSLRSIFFIKWTEFLNFSHFRSLVTLSHLLLYALFIGLKLYRWLSNAFLRWAQVKLESQSTGVRNDPIHEYCLVGATLG